MKSPRSNAVVFGVAISATELCLAGRDGTVSRVCPLPPMSDGNGEPWRAALPDALREALRDLVRERGRDGTRGAPSSDARAALPVLRVALMPSLADVRMVPLPPVNETDAVRILSRTASRFFLDVQEPLVLAVSPVTVGAERLESPAPATGAPTGTPPALPLRLACAASQTVVRAIHEAAAGAGCQVECIVPALGAWTLALPVGTTAAVVMLPQHIELFTVLQGAPASLRRFRVSGDEAALAEAAADHARPGTIPPHITDAAAAAARALATASGGLWPLQFIGPDDTRRVPLPAHRRGPTQWAALLVLLVVLGVFAREWRTKEALEQVRAERAALAPSVAATAPRRVRFEQARLLAAPDSVAWPGWSRLLARVSDALPDDAHLTRVRTRGDTLIVEGLAAHAGTVFDALSGLPGFVGVHASAPVRRETAADGATVDRFQFTLPRGGR